MKLFAEWLLLQGPELIPEAAATTTAGVRVVAVVVTSKMQEEFYHLPLILFNLLVMYVQNMQPKYQHYKEAW